MQTFGERVAELRIKSGFTQKVIGEKVGVTKSAFANYESGERHPNFETVVKIADALNVSVDYLLGRTDQPFMAVAGERSAAESFETALQHVRQGVVEGRYTLGGRPMNDFMKQVLLAPINALLSLADSLLGNTSKED
jgi:transcriptional regulator with XRE-family HTH domain